MRITCPNCSKNFIASKEQIGIPGRRVKCSNCKRIWFQTLDLSTKLKEDEPPINHTEKINSTNTKEQEISSKVYLPAILPVKVKTPKSENILDVSSLCVIIFCLLLIFYNDLNIPNWHLNDHSLNIENIQTTQNKELGQVTVSYSIQNRSQYDITIPLISIRLFNKELKTVKSYVMNQKNIKLKPYQHVDITTTLDIVPPSSALLDIMLGNSLDFILQ
jgi:predicted Zn finger-like uncharacterized protein